ncbi:HAD family hydrolase [Micropruina sp.]|uniref:HAD family hydrolase n=1 Tax=Micropruina sp. TaxID=2737536 RepID=UPI0039E2BFE5
MIAFTLAEQVRAPDRAWAELVAHPELLFGYGAPDLVAGQRYRATSQLGSGGSGVIESVEPARVAFTWGGPHWPRPGRFVASAGTELVIDARDLPETEASAARAHWQHMVSGAVRYLDSSNPALTGPVEAVLFDADGVLQQPRRGWLDDFVRLGGPDFVPAAFAAEVQCLTGAGDLRAKLTSLLRQAGTGAEVDRVLAVWHDIVVDHQALAVVNRVRRQGLVVGLATNQQSYRGAHMRDVLGLDRHFDRTFYSYEVGHAKPSVAYFAHIAEALRLPPERIAFADDTGPNVVGARTAGLRSVLHRSVTGADGLAAGLRSLGVPI